MVVQKHTVISQNGWWSFFSVLIEKYFQLLIKILLSPSTLSFEQELQNQTPPSFKTEDIFNIFLCTWKIVQSNKNRTVEIIIQSRDYLKHDIQNSLERIQTDSIYKKFCWKDLNVKNLGFSVEIYYILLNT